MAGELTELQGLMYLTDQQRKGFLLRQLEIKRELETTLEGGVEDPLEENTVREALEIVVNNIQRLRVEGLIE